SKLDDGKVGVDVSARQRDLSPLVEADIEQSLLAPCDKRVVDREVEALDGHLIATELHQATDESMAQEPSAAERAHDATDGRRQKPRPTSVYVHRVANHGTVA